VICLQTTNFIVLFHFHCNVPFIVTNIDMYTELFYYLGYNQCNKDADTQLVICDACCVIKNFTKDFAMNWMFFFKEHFFLYIFVYDVRV
jgi:hypothetical protein